MHDAYRAGALRFRLYDADDFLDNQHGTAAPPFLQLRALEAASLARQFESNHHTYLVKRFDRTPAGRLHFASAMTLTGHQDGDDAFTCATTASSSCLARVGTCPLPTI